MYPKEIDKGSMFHRRRHYLFLQTQKARIAREISPKAIGLSMFVNAGERSNYFALQPGVGAEDAGVVAGRSK